MKKICLLLLFVVIISLSACSEKVDPIENPEIELFSVFYEAEEFTIYKRTVIEEQAYYTIGYSIDSGYLLGAYHMQHYRVLYEEEYYDLQAGHILGLYTAEELMDYGVTGLSRSCSYDDTCDE